MQCMGLNCYGWYSLKFIFEDFGENEGRLKACWDNSLKWENVEFVSETMCVMVRRFLERTAGNGGRARDFGRNYIKHAVPRVTDYCC